MKAFTLLEFILVCLVMSLVFALAKINVKEPSKLEAGASQIIKDLDYTRSLALMQGSFRSGASAVATGKNGQWFKARWQLYFIKSKASNSKQSYAIFLDKNGDGNANLGRSNANLNREIALDLIDPSKFMMVGQSGVIDFNDARSNPHFNIEEKFGIVEVELFGACAGTSQKSKATRIVYDEFGRLYTPLKDAKNPYENVVFTRDEKCIIKLSDSKKQSLCIELDSLSGFAKITQCVV